MEDSNMTLAEATAFALERNGAGVMDNPNRFLAQIADVMDPDGDEMRVLMLLRLCNDSLLAPFRAALSGAIGPDVAEARAREYLVDECRIELGTASAVAAGIADGVAVFLGVAPKMRTQVTPQAPSKPSSEESRGLRPEHDATLVVTPGRQAEPAAQQRYAEPLPSVRPEQSRGRDIRIDLEISETEARDGAVKTVSYSLPSTGKEARCEVLIPTGAIGGELVTVPGGGDHGTNGGARGDLRVQLHVVADREQGSKKGGTKSSKLTRRAVLVLAGGAGLAGVAALLGSLSRGTDSGDTEAAAESTESGEENEDPLEDAAEEPVEEPEEKTSEEPQDEGLAPIVAISAGGMQTVGLRSNGDVCCAGNTNVVLWGDAIAVSVGASHVVGLHPDGTVSATGFNEYGKCDVRNWSDITAISAGDYHTVGLHSDGTVVTVGRNNFGQCDASIWEDIVAVSAGWGHTVGLHSDGTVVAVGQNADGQCDILRWSDISAISAGGDHTVGLHPDGTAVAMGRNYDGQCDVEGWSDLVAISAGYDFTVGLRSDGTAVAVGSNSYGQCEVEEWSDLVAVSAGFSHTVGLRSDGKVVAVGDSRYGICDVSDW